MRKLLLTLLLSLVASPVWGQCSGVFPANTLCGNLTTSANVPSAFSASGTIAGPTTSTNNGLPKWGNTLGTQLIDAAGTTIAGTYIFSGIVTHTNVVSISQLNVVNNPISVSGSNKTFPPGTDTLAGLAAAQTFTALNTFTNIVTFTTPANFTSGLKIGGTQVDLPIIVSNGGTGNTSATNHSIPINAGTTAQNNTGTGSTGQCIVSTGASADPAFTNGCPVLLNTLTAATSTSLTDSTSLTSTYNNYELLVTNLIPSLNGTLFTLRVDSGGIKATTYLNSGIWASAAGPQNMSTPLTTAIQLSPINTTNTTTNCLNATPGISGTIRVNNPSGSGKSIWMVALTCLGGDGTDVHYLQSSGLWNVSGAITGFTVLPGNGTISSGNIRVYGRR